MKYEKKVLLAGDSLSIRGNEESSLGNFGGSINLNIS